MSAGRLVRRRGIVRARKRREQASLQFTRRQVPPHAEPFAGVDRSVSPDLLWSREVRGPDIYFTTEDAWHAGQIYGDGSDGDVMITETTTIARDMHYNSLHIEPPAYLHANGHAVRVRGTLIGADRLVTGQVPRPSPALTIDTIREMSDRILRG